MAHNKFENKIRHTKLELDQHIEIMQLQDMNQRLVDALKDVQTMAKQGIFPHLPVDTKGAQMCIEIDKYVAELLSEYNRSKVGGFEGSVFKSPGPGICIGCISPEARDLLDTIMAEWEKHYKNLKETNGEKYEPEFYGFAYWLVRWSGLIQPTTTTTK